MPPGDPPSLAVADLLALALGGRLRPLPLPRGSRWTESKSIEFLDSVVQNFPTGSLILGKAPAAAASVRIGRWSVEAPAASEAWWIIDGHHRIGALVEALLSPGNHGLSFDLSTWTFLPGAPPEDRQGELPGLSVARHLPPPALAAPEPLFDWLRLHPQTREVTGRLLRLGEQIRSHRMPVQVVSMENPDILGTLFERANGERLDAVDRFSLRHGLSEEGGSSLARTAGSLRGLGFGVIEDETILRALRAIATGEDLAGADLPGLLRKTEAALRRAIVFLQVNGGIPHGALLPYTLPLAVLSRFFHEHPRPQAPSRELLRQWLWRGALGLALGGHGERHLDAIHHGDEEGSARHLIALVPEAMTPEVLRQDRFHAAHARSRLQLCALASLRPRHTSGQELDLEALLSPQEASIPTLLDAPTSPCAHGVSNRLLHPREAGLVRSLAGASAEVWASHGIDEEAGRALQAGDAEGFLERRSRTLNELFLRYFSRQSGPA